MVLFANYTLYRSFFPILINMGPKGVSKKQLKYSFIGQLATDKKKVSQADSCLNEQKEILDSKLSKVTDCTVIESHSES